MNPPNHDTRDLADQPGVDALIEALPRAYAAWEAEIASGEINRVQARVEALLRKDDNPRPGASG